MGNFNIAVVGATGAVGREMIKILEERNFPFNKVKFIATEKSVGKEINFFNEVIKVEKIKDGVFNDIDIALFSIGSGPSREIVPNAVNEGAIVIDNSNAFRMREDVPLVVPEINSEKIFEHNGIIANPNCSTIQLVMALKPIYDDYGIKRLVISTYQAVSGTGKKAIDELNNQISQYISNEDITYEVYPEQIVFNALPHIDIFMENNYTREEMKMIRETRKILNCPNLKITATAVRVPVFYGHSESVNIELNKDIVLEELIKLLNSTEGLRVVEKYPLARMSEEIDDVMVGRIRKDESLRYGINLWIVANNLRKGAALNAVQIAEKLIAGGLK